jgi:hypothetical protein
VIPKTPFAQAEAITWFGRAIGSSRSGRAGEGERSRRSIARAQGQACQGERCLLDGLGGNPGAGCRGLDSTRGGPQSGGHCVYAPGRRSRRSQRQTGGTECNSITTIPL